MSSPLVNEFEPSDDHAAIREGVRGVVTRFIDAQLGENQLWLGSAKASLIDVNAI